MDIKSRHHLVVQYSQRLVGGEILQFGLEDDGVSPPARLNHLLPVLIVETTFVLDQAEDTQVLAHVPCHRALAEIQTLYGRAGGTHRDTSSIHRYPVTRGNSVFISPES